MKKLIDELDKSIDKYSPKMPNNRRPYKLSFGTTAREEDIIEKIFKEKEFLSEIPSPRCKLKI